MADLMRARVLAISCGYPDANDLTTPRKDPAFELACGRLSTRRRGLPESGNDLASQPTLSRWENTPDRLRGRLVARTAPLVLRLCPVAMLRSRAPPVQDVAIDHERQKQKL